MRCDPTPAEPDAGPEIVAIAAVARNGVIGNGPDIPWHIPGEQARFKRLTTGHALVMGRSTYDSIGRPLPNRTTVVLTRDPSWSVPGVLVAHDLDTALDLAVAADPDGPVWVVGGGEVYALAMARCTRLEITEVEQEPPGDAFFPSIDAADWTESAREPGAGFAYVTYHRAVWGAEGGTRTLTPEGTGT